MKSSDNNTQQIIEKIKTIKSNLALNIVKGENDFQWWLGENPEQKDKTETFSKKLGDVLTTLGIAQDYRDGYNEIDKDSAKLESLINTHSALNGCLKANIDSFLKVSADFKEYVEGVNKGREEDQQALQEMREKELDGEFERKFNRFNILYSSNEEILRSKITKDLENQDMQKASDDIRKYLRNLDHLITVHQLSSNDPNKLQEAIGIEIKKLISSFPDQESKITEMVINHPNREIRSAGYGVFIKDDLDKGDKTAASDKISTYFAKTFSEKQKLVKDPEKLKAAMDSEMKKLFSSCPTQESQLAELILNNPKDKGPDIAEMILNHPDNDIRKAGYERLALLIQGDLGKGDKVAASDKISTYFAKTFSEKQKLVQDPEKLKAAMDSEMKKLFSSCPTQESQLAELILNNPKDKGPDIAEMILNHPDNDIRKAGYEGLALLIQGDLGKGDKVAASDKIFTYFANTFAQNQELVTDPAKLKEVMDQTLKQLLSSCSTQQKELMEMIASPGINDATSRSMQTFVGSGGGMPEDSASPASSIAHINSTVVVSAIMQQHKGELTKCIQEYSKSYDPTHLDKFTNDIKEMTQEISAAMKDVDPKISNYYVASSMKDMLEDINNSLTFKERFKSDFVRLKNDFNQQLDNAMGLADSSHQKFNILDKINDIVQSIMIKLSLKSSMRHHDKENTFVQMISENKSENQGISR